MKSSLKFREEQKPVFKAKVPISILGLPFQSGLTAGDSKELSLTLSTIFDTGPAFRVSYRPNDSFNPFSLTIKSGIGHFGSPANAAMTMSAEFNFLGNCKSLVSAPRFMIHFKPRLGDFSLRKSNNSAMSAFMTGEEEEDGEMVEKPGRVMTLMSLPLRRTVESAVEGMELGARTSLPVRNGAVLNFNWGVKFPADGLSNWFKDPTRKMSLSPHGVPLLVLNKIGIEHVAEVDDKEEKVVANGVGVHGFGSESSELAESCFGVKRELETLRFENSRLGKALEDLKAEFGYQRGGVKGGERKLLGCERDGVGENTV